MSLFTIRAKDKEKIHHVGAARGSIVGPGLWNISYDDTFHIGMPNGLHLVGYADNVAAIIVVRNGA